jgi:hypothetical protein
MERSGNRQGFRWLLYGRRPIPADNIHRGVVGRGGRQSGTLT